MRVVTLVPGVTLHSVRATRVTCSTRFTRLTRLVLVLTRYWRASLALAILTIAGRAGGLAAT